MIDARIGLLIPRIVQLDAVEKEARGMPPVRHVETRS